MNGQRQLVFVTGEPGIGKTALVEAFLSQIDGDRDAAHRSWAMRGAVRRRRSLLAAARGARTTGSRGRGRTGGADPQAACADLADSVAGAAGRPGSRGRAAPSAGGHARPDAAGAGGGPGHPERATRPSSCSWKTCTGATRPRSTCWRGWPRRREAARLLVLGTYRPADVAAGAHPLRPVKQELQLHGHCEEMPLAFLSAAAVATYLAQRFPRHELSIGARARAASDDRRQPALRREHDRRSDCPGSDARGRRDVGAVRGR